MADPPPFGFGLPGDRDKDPDDSQQPSGAGQTPGAGGLGPLGDPQQFADALRQFADLMTWKGGPVNWDLAKQMAVSALAVGVVLSAVGLVLFRGGSRSLSGDHLLPRRTLESIKEDARWARRQF